MSTKKAAAKEAVINKPVGMTVVAMQAENIKKLSMVRIRPKHNVIVVGGDNGSGKTSVLDALQWALDGVSTVPSAPIRKGQRYGRVQVDLGDFKVTRNFQHVEGGKTPYLSKLEITGKMGEKFPNPQTLLNSFMGTISFNPLEFVEMESAEQLKTLRKMVNITELTQIEADKKLAYDARREAGRELDSAKARLSAIAKPSDGLPLQPIDTAAITAELQQVAAKNGEREKAIYRKQDIANVSAMRTEDAEGADQDAASIQAQIEELQQELQRAKERAERYRIEAQEKFLESAAIEIPQEVSSEAIAQRLEEANRTNRAIEAAAHYVSVSNQVKDAEASWNDQNATVKQKDQERADLLAAAKMPIEGIAIGDDEVLYNDLPFEQASNAEQIRVSVAMAMASNPKLRIMLIRDGSLLDDKSLAAIEKMADSENYQIWIERVGNSKQVSVVMEDGEASGEDVEVVQRGKS